MQILEFYAKQTNGSYLKRKKRAKGFGRGSDADFSRFLYMAMGSCSEVRSMLYLASERRYMPSENTGQLQQQCIETSKIIKGLMKSLAPGKYAYN